MKKTYISPVAQVTYLTSHAIMSGSIKGVSGASDLGVGGNSSDASVTSGNSRSDNSWDIWGSGDYED